MSDKKESKLDKIEEFVEYEETRLARWGYKIIIKLFGPIIRWIWIRQVEGLENIPKKGSVIIASNHESYFDFICFTAVSPRKIHYLAAEVFFKKPIWRILMKLTGQIKVDRQAKNKSRTHQLVLSALDQGRMLGIFPEGTRSSDGKLQKAYTGIAKFALNSKTPIIPVGIIGTYEIMSRHDKKPRFDKKCIIKIGKPMHLDEYYETEHHENLYRKITDDVMLKIGELTGKEYVHTESEKGKIIKEEIREEGEIILK